MGNPIDQIREGNEYLKNMKFSDVLDKGVDPREAIINLGSSKNPEAEIYFANEKTNDRAVSNVKDRAQEANIQPGTFITQINSHRNREFDQILKQTVSKDEMPSWTAEVSGQAKDKGDFGRN